MSCSVIGIVGVVERGVAWRGVDLMGAIGSGALHAMNFYIFTTTR